MPIDDPRSYISYAESRAEVARRLEFSINVEKLQDEMRRIKQGMTFDAFAALIPGTVAKYANSFPTGGDVSTQNLFDFLKLKSPSMPSADRRLAYHAFMMVVDEGYREKWNGSHFVVRAGLTLTQFFATNRETNPYAHAKNLQQSSGLYEYKLDELAVESIGKPGFEKRCLFLSAPKNQPFLLAYDFDVSNAPDKAAFKGSDYADEQIERIQQSWDLDARVGFYIPKRSTEEGILLLNSFKWDWPTIYAAILNYLSDGRLDDSDGMVSDIMLSDVNSYLNIERTEKSYMASDYEIPDTRKLMAMRQSGEPKNLQKFADLLERKFDWGADL